MDKENLKEFNISKKDTLRKCIYTCIRVNAKMVDIILTLYRIGDHAARATVTVNSADLGHFSVPGNIFVQNDGVFDLLEFRFEVICIYLKK